MCDSSTASLCTVRIYIRYCDWDMENRRRYPLYVESFSGYIRPSNIRNGLEFMMEWNGWHCKLDHASVLCRWSVPMYRIKEGLIYSEPILFRCIIISIARSTHTAHSACTRLGQIFSNIWKRREHNRSLRKMFYSTCWNGGKHRWACKLMIFVYQTFCTLFASVANWPWPNDKISSSANVLVWLAIRLWNPQWHFRFNLRCEIAISILP